MGNSRVERRRGRRAHIQAPVVIRRFGSGGPEDSIGEEVTTNVSLAGIYFETHDAQPYAINDTLLASVSIPEPHTREFPFTRVAGRTRVVRINELPTQGSTQPKRFGIALEFGSDVTALTALPSRG